MSSPSSIAGNVSDPGDPDGTGTNVTEDSTDPAVYTRVIPETSGDCSVFGVHVGDCVIGEVSPRFVLCDFPTEIFKLWREGW